MPHPRSHRNAPTGRKQARRRRHEPPDGSLSIDSCLARLRAVLCRDGVDQMRADAELAVATMPQRDILADRGSPTSGDGAPDGWWSRPGRCPVRRGAAEGRTGGTMLGPCALGPPSGRCWRSPGCLELGERHLSEGRSLARAANLEDSPRSRSCIPWPRGWRWTRPTGPRAREELTGAQRLRPALTYGRR